MADELTLAFQQELTRTRKAAGDAAKRLWDNLGSYNEADIARYAAQVAPIVGAAQQRAVALTDSYLSTRLGVAPVGLVAADVVAGVRNGIGLEAVLRRGFQDVWAGLATSDTKWATLVEQAGARVATAMDTNVLLAYTHANIAYGKSSSTKIYGWNRVPGAGCCDYCSDIAGSGSRMYVSDLMPMHNHCNCSVEPVTRQIHADDRLGIGDVIGLATVRDHGELGPMVMPADDEFHELAGVQAKDYKKFVATVEVAQAA